MTPKVLFIGAGDKGAWQMRGKQLAEVLGARYGSKAHQIDWAWPDVIVLVKRAAEQYFREAAACGKAVIWDVLDFWRQPSANDRTREDLVREVVQTGRALQATLIGATQAMASDIGGIYLPHHCRFGLVPTPPRPRLEVVGYDGSERYLGAWRPALEQACARHGLTFVINPPDLAQVDLFVALRDREWDGWACRQWKSGVKYVNAIAAGRPILTQMTAAFTELQPHGLIVEQPALLDRVLELADDADWRQRVYEDSLPRAADFTMEAIARRYEQVIDTALRQAA